jgi:hypothetical protein
LLSVLCFSVLMCSVVEKKEKIRAIRVIRGCSIPACLPDGRQAPDHREGGQVCVLVI